MHAALFISPLHQTRAFSLPPHSPSARGEALKEESDEGHVIPQHYPTALQLYHLQYLQPPHLVFTTHPISSISPYTHTTPHLESTVYDLGEIWKVLV